MTRSMPRWTELEDQLLLREMTDLGDEMTERKKAKRIHRKHMLPGRTVKATQIHYHFLLKKAGQTVKKLGSDAPPLLKVMFLLDKARKNDQAWDRVFPKALKVAEDVSVDIEKARVELEKTMTAVRVVQTMHADKLDAEMDDCDKALRAQMLVDRQMKAKN